MTRSPLRGRHFHCREWALQRLQHCMEGLGTSQTLGILITGAAGAGKTALCTEILWPSSEAGHCSRLSSRVLAYHFCQAHTHASLNPHHFIRSLAQQLRDSPLISGYKEDTEKENDQGDLDETFKRLVALPLMSLPPPSQNLLLVVDSVDETCCCCSDGFLAESAIAKLLSNHHQLLPPWLLLVCSARRQNKTVTRMFTGFRRLCLDDLRKAHIVRDVQQYILCRLDHEENLRQHLTLDTAEMLNQLHIKSNGCFLYLERVLDGISDGSILLREIRHIPGTLNGLYLWLCQRLFPGSQFCKVQTLLNVLLASPQPLSPTQLLQAMWTKQVMGWSAEDFNISLESISVLLVPLEGSGDSKVIFHHSFSEWLLDVKYCTQRFLCSVAEGHSMLAMSLSAQASVLTPTEVHHLARHLLLSDTQGLDPSVLALWLLWTDVPVSDCLASNLPLELEVVQLLLLAGGAVDEACNVVDSNALMKTLKKGDSIEMLLESGAGVHQRDRSGRTLLAAAADAGNLETASLMISRGANLEATDEEGQTPLALAAHQGHLNVVKLLLQHGAQHDHTDGRGWTPLRSAAWGGYTDVVEVLLASGAQPDACGPDGRTALRAAAWGGHDGAVKALLEAGAQIDRADEDGRTPLIAASYMGHRYVTELLLAAGADVNRCDAEGRSALAVASLCVPTGNEYPMLVSQLLEHGADPELEDKDGVTPLLVAAYEGQAEIAELLLEAGANPDREDKGRMTPLLAAASGGHAEAIRVLLLWGSTIDVKDAEGRSALELAAAAGGGEQAVRVLLARGLDENHRDQLGWTPLHWAACLGRRSSCKALIEGRAKVGFRDHEGYTALLLAAQEGHTGCVDLLLSRGSRVEQFTRDRRTALCLAALAGHRSTVELLLRAGADPNVKNQQGKPLLYRLALEGQIDMVELLLEHGADPEGTDPEERTALHACCWQGDLEMAHLLLVKGGAKSNSSDIEKRTPLHCAAWKGHSNIARVLLDNGAFSDAQASQGATPLCIAAQEGHEELAKVLLEEGKACPHHADHYRRTPISIAGKGGHIGIVKLLERYGVHAYHGPLGMEGDKKISEERAAEGNDGSWSTLSPVSTGSHSQGNSLKSSKGSILTSSTYHSQATVPMDSLTFTQQLQQHSLPRSRSQQIIALTEMDMTFQDQHYCIAHQNPSTFHQADKWDEFRIESPTSPDREPNPSGRLTNPTCGSPVYTNGKSSGDGSFRVRTNNTTTSIKNNPELRSIPLHTSSSGYSSSRTDNISQKKSGKSKKVWNFVHSEKRQNPKPCPHIKGPPGTNKKHEEPLCSSGKMTGSVTSGETTVYPQSMTRPPVCSPSKSRSHVSLPSKPASPVYSPSKPGPPVYSPSRSGPPVYSPSRSGPPVYSPSRSGPPVYSPSKSGPRVYSPGKKPDHRVHSPQLTDGGGCSSHSTKMSSPVISITTMDPQLHLKQAIKLQFEGRTCGFDMRKETPL